MTRSNFFQKAKSFFLLSASERRANRRDREFQKWLNTYDPPNAAGKVVLKKCYLDNNFNNWYFCSDPLHTTKERIDMIEEAVRDAEYNIEKSDVVAHFQKSKSSLLDCRQLLKDRKYKELDKTIERISADTSDIEFRMSQLGTESLMLRLAIVFFYIEGESPYTVNQLTLQRKKELIEADDDLRAFFLQTTWNLFRASTNIGGQDFLNYLTKEKFNIKAKNQGTTKQRFTKQGNKRKMTNTISLKDQQPNKPK